MSARAAPFADEANAFQQLYRREPVLTGFAIALAAMMVVSIAGLFVDARTFNGINVWIKPLKFQSSAAIFLLTLALFWPYLDAAQRQRKSVRAAAWIVGASLLLEVLYITYRAALGEASHFNRATPVDELLYVWMGVTIFVVTVVSGWTGWMILRARDRIANPGLRFAIGVGLIAGMALGSITGAYTSAQTSHWVGGLQTDANGSLLFGWSRSGGDLRVSHFVGLHAMQGIPLIGWLASRYRPANVRGIVLAASAIWTFATFALLAVALAGRSPLPL